MASISIRRVGDKYEAFNKDVGIKAYGKTKEEAFRNLESKIILENMKGVKNEF